MNISELSIEQLKAAAYDHVCSMNRSQQAVQVIETELAKRAEQPQAEVPTPKPRRQRKPKPE